MRGVWVDSAVRAPRAAAMIFWPTLPPVGIVVAPAPAVAVVPPAAPGAIAPWSIDANWDDDPPGPLEAGAAGVVGVVAATGGASIVLSSEMRATTD